MPNPRKKQQDGSGLDGLAARYRFTFKRARAFGNENDLISLQNAALAPIEMMIHRMSRRRIGGVWRDDCIAHRTAHAPPDRVGRLHREINKIVFHSYSNGQSKGVGREFQPLGYDTFAGWIFAKKRRC